ncbi:MAG: EAL domain-containing protein [Sideroxyarcus sp.]|nr:EAL domain-containing protein [Sideroxyarcus sp.]
MERTLLLVDDEKDVGAALERLLRGDGYTILHANSGREGLEILAQHEVGVVVSDQRMPGMTGIEFLTEVKALYPHTIRMVLTGYADLDTVKEAINRGAIYKFLTKPWDNDTLRGDVMEAFGRFELAQQRAGLLQQIQSANELLAELNIELAAAMERKDSQIDHAVHHDHLTNLPNRLLFLDRLDQELTRAHRDNHMAAVLMIDLDHFKQVNDSFGFHIGDEVLKLASERLVGLMRACDTIARIAGDKFGIVLTGVKDSRYAGEVAQKILDSFAQEPFVVEGNEFFITLCLGISVYPVDGLNTATLLNNADAAMYHAKKDGRHHFLYYAGQMNASAWQRLKLESELRRALTQKEFVLHYQPKVDMADGRIVGMEALLRWQSPERGLVAPGEFIPLLEETSLILPVGEWALREACRQARAWRSAGFTDIRIAVNLSVMQLKQPDFVGMVLGILQEHGLDPALKMIELELTESMLMDNVQGTIETLQKLHDAGIQFSIDDFGTGYSSLSYLKRFPISSLKIDQSFVRDLSTDPNDEAIVAAVIALGHSLGLRVIAEGVETEDQQDKLRAKGCNEMQGFLFSRAVPAAAMTELLQKNARPSSLQAE